MTSEEFEVAKEFCRFERAFLAKRLLRHIPANDGTNSTKERRRLIAVALLEVFAHGLLIGFLAGIAVSALSLVMHLADL